MKFQEKPESGAAALSIANVGGIFAVLLVGLGIACITAVIEYVWIGRRITDDRKVRFIPVSQRKS